MRMILFLVNLYGAIINYFTTCISSITVIKYIQMVKILIVKLYIKK
jgi:hypothetical protein